MRRHILPRDAFSIARLKQLFFFGASFALLMMHSTFFFLSLSLHLRCLNAALSDEWDDKFFASSCAHRGTSRMSWNCFLWVQLSHRQVDVNGEHMIFLLVLENSRMFCYFSLSLNLYGSISASDLFPWFESISSCNVFRASVIFLRELCFPILVKIEY